jgi:hypothetical protein
MKWEQTRNRSGMKYHSWEWIRTFRNELGISGISGMNEDSSRTGGGV